MLCQLIVDALGGKAKLADFMPDFGREPVQQTTEMLKAQMHQIAVAHNEAL